MVWPMESRLETSVLFGINGLMHKGLLSGPTLDKEFFTMVEKEDKKYIAMALEELSWKEDCVSPSWITGKCHDIQNDYYAPQLELELDARLGSKIWALTITPSKFTDEDHNKLKDSMLRCKFKSLSAYQHTEVYEKVKVLLDQGVRIGGKSYEFLAYSVNQVRKKSSLWMVADGGISTGDFSAIKNVSKYAARMGQCFSQIENHCTGPSLQHILMHFLSPKNLPSIQEFHSGI
ncbi:RNA-dependent RNA polymerase, eukaryotic-type [Corchorus capsularis]|uniref:RNA-dependent RNA polymerase n=1 Tax=Corchorus capsularis TaxID=210143 RepID=A0A1R3HIZ6_COCAP|nr:RNA-dependent RNA polymerase, eukaryotic-type [Corchorus capsularis]